MIEQIGQWFRALSQREKVLITIAAVLVVGVGGYYGVVRPLVGAMSGAEERYSEAVARQARIESKVAALSGSDGDTKNGFAGSLDEFVSQSAGETGIAIGIVDAQSNGTVNVTVESAKPTALFGWLARIEEKGVAVENLSAKPNANQTISATMTLRSN